MYNPISKYRYHFKAEDSLPFCSCKKIIERGFEISLFLLFADGIIRAEIHQKKTGGKYDENKKPNSYRFPP